MTARAPDQHLTALERANDIRSRGSKLRGAISALPEADGRRLIIHVILEDPLDDAVGAMPASRLLKSAHRIGDRDASAILRRAGVAQVGRRVRELTPRQRRVVAETLGDLRHLHANSSRPFVPLPDARPTA